MATPESPALKENQMNLGAVRWTLAHLDNWAWVIAEYRVWVIIGVTIVGLAAPLLRAARRGGPRPSPALVVRGGALALAFSAAVVTVCSLLHFSDLRWLPVAQRTSAHLSAPGGVFGFAKPIVTAVNTVTGVPAEIRATQVSVHTAISCALLSLAALLVVAVSWRRAHRAEISQIVREEVRRSIRTYASES
jgi:hypothetical protein